MVFMQYLIITWKIWTKWNCNLGIYQLDLTRMIRDPAGLSGLINIILRNRTIVGSFFEVG